MHRWILLVAIAQSIFLSSFGVGPAHAVDLRSEVDSAIAAFSQPPSFVGVVVGVVQGDRRHVFCYGETAKGSKTLPTGRTLYEIGSITKVFTGVLLGSAVERRELMLEDPVAQHLPDGTTISVYEDQPIRLEHLASHTSGLPRLPGNMPLPNPWNPYARYDSKLLYAFVESYKPTRPPGETEYSNLGMGLLGDVLARRAGVSYEELVVTRICDPLAMHNTRITLDEDQRARLAPPYNGLFLRVQNWDLAALAGAGALRSTCDDMLKFIEAQFADDDRPITRALRRARVIQHRRDDGIGVGLAWHQTRDTQTWMHNGKTGGYTAYLKVTPARRTGVVVLANRSTDKVTELDQRISEMLSRDIGERVLNHEAVEPSE